MQKVPQFHERLSHLVKYSSQLVFVSGDTVADQHKALADFMGHQQEDTEISFFKAKPEGTIQEYRSSIAKHLTAIEEFDYSKPLKSLLSNDDNLDPTQGPYLICITQSEYIENKFVEELWDWMQTMQLANANLHINIILFGSPEWAKKTYNMLPTNGVVTPIILSAKEVDPVGFDVNALESLMADKHSWLSVNNQPLVTNKWFLGSVLSIFVAIFVSLMSSIYADSYNEESTNNITPTITDAPNKHIEINTDIQSDNTLNIFAKDYHQSEIFSSVQDHSGLDERQNQPHSFIFLAAQSSPNQLIDNSTIDSLPKIIKPQKRIALNTINQIEKIDDQITNINQVEPYLSQPSIDKAKSGLTDFAVPDIKSVEELAFKLSSSAREVNRVNGENINFSSKTNVDYQFDETTLLSLPTDTIVLQLSGMQNPVVLENYLKNNNLKSSTWVYETQRYGGPWYVIVYNQAFESIDSALSNLSLLPIDIRESQPFAKSINQIQQEINQR